MKCHFLIETVPLSGECSLNSTLGWARDPETTAEARKRIAEVIDLADHDVVELARRAAEREVIDLLNEPSPMRSVKSALAFALYPERMSG
jgi:hypothetical protein